MAPVVGRARAHPLLACAGLALMAALVLLALGGCAADPAVERAAAGSAGSVPATSATGTAAPTGSVVPASPAPTASTTIAAPSETSAAPPGAAPPTGVVRGLATTTSTQTFVDAGRPTISKGRTIATARTLATTIVRPVSGGPYPLVVFAHGFQLGPSHYQRLMSVIASAGYVVAAPSFPLADAAIAGGHLDRGDIPVQSGDLSFVIDEVLSGPLAGSIDGSRIGAVGHSDGADTVLDLGFHPRRVDPRVRAVAALAPDAMTDAAVAGPPLLVVHGDRDSIVPFSNATAVFSQVPSPRHLVTLVGADHLPPFQGAAPWAAVVEAAVLDLLDARVAERSSGDGALIRDASVAGVATVRGA